MALEFTVSITGITRLSFEQDRVSVSYTIRNTNSKNPYYMNRIMYDIGCAGAVDIYGNAYDATHPWWSSERSISGTLSAGSSRTGSATFDVPAGNYNIDHQVTVHATVYYSDKDGYDAAQYKYGGYLIMNGRPSAPSISWSGAQSFGSLQTLTASRPGSGTLSWTSKTFTPQESDTPDAKSKTYTYSVTNAFNGWERSAEVSRTFTVGAYSISISGGRLTAFNGNPAYESETPCVNLTGIQTGAISVGNLHGASLRTLTVTPDGDEPAKVISNGGNATWDEVRKSGARTFAVHAEDSRGEKADAVITGTVAQYAPPEFTSLQAHRVPSVGDVLETSDGHYLYASADVSLSNPESGKNNSSVVSLYLTRTANDGSSWPADTVGGDFSATSGQLWAHNEGIATSASPGVTYQGITGSLDVEYVLNASVTDAYGFSASSSRTISPAIPLIDFGANGNSVGIHAVADPDAKEKEVRIGGRVKIPGMAGIIYPFAGSTAPEGFLMCDGASYIRADYPELFAVIGTIYGAADSTHFNVPDLRGRVAIGSSGSHALGTAGGEELHALSNDEMPAHEGHLSANDAAYVPRYGDTNSYYINTASAYSGMFAKYADRPWQILAGNEMTLKGFTRGGSQAHNNMQPFVTTNYIISTGVNASPHSESETRNSLFVSDLSVSNSISGVVSDYPVAQGKSGVWTWRNWNSGIRECWGTITKTIDITSQWGASIYIGTFSDDALPAGFVGVDSCDYAISNAGSYTVWVIKTYGYGVSTTRTPSTFVACAGPASGQLVGMSYHVIGRWK